MGDYWDEDLLKMRVRVILSEGKFGKNKNKINGWD